MLLMSDNGATSLTKTACVESEGAMRAFSERHALLQLLHLPNQCCINADPCAPTGSARPTRFLESGAFTLRTDWLSEVVVGGCPYSFGVW